LRDEQTPDDFVKIEQALKRLPYFDPSRGFADKVMARVARFQAVAAPGSIQPAPRVVRMPELSPHRDEVVHYMRRPLPVRLVAMALVGSAAVTMSVVILIAAMRPDLFVFVAQIFGGQALDFMAALGNGVAGSVFGDTGLGYVQGGSVAGAATIGMFVLGAVGATAVLRAAASTTRKAA
jgi:hypothetical protein